MKIKKGFSLRDVMGQSIVLAEGSNADTYNKIIALNPSAAMLWKELAGKKFTADDAAALLVDHYGIDEGEARADASRIIALMASKDLLDE